MSADPTAEQIAIANLAVLMLPKIDLPEGWEVMNPQSLQRQLADVTTPFAEIKLKDGTPFPVRSSVEKSLTPFEVIAEAAVARARILLASASGNIRDTRKQRRAEVVPLKEQVLAENKLREKRAAILAQWQAKLEKRFSSSPNASLATAELLCLVLPKSKPDMRQLYWREFLRQEARQEVPEGVKVVFKDEHQPGAECHLIDDELEVLWPKQALNFLARRAARFTEFYQQHGGAILKKHLSTHPKTEAGGKQTAKAKEEQAFAEAAKYGGDASVSGIKLRQSKRAVSKSPKAR